MDITVTVLGLPTVTISQMSYIVNQGSNVTLNCSVSSPTSTPVYSVQWQKVIGSSYNNINTATFNKYSGSTINEPSLTILNAQSRDAGTYRCTATNSVGTAQSVAAILNGKYLQTCSLPHFFSIQ